MKVVGMVTMDDVPLAITNTVFSQIWCIFRVLLVKPPQRVRLAKPEIQVSQPLCGEGSSWEIGTCGQGAMASARREVSMVA